MGYGDEIMATAEARRLFNDHGPDIAIAIGDGSRVRWSPVFEFNPILATQACLAGGVAVRWCGNYSGHRPYIDYDQVLALGRAVIGDGGDHKKTIKAAGRWAWIPGQVPTPGEIYFSGGEGARANEYRAAFGDRPTLIIEPNIKAGGNSNKKWGFGRYQEVVDGLAGEVRFIQVGPRGIPRLSGADHIITPGFRDALVVLSAAGGYVGPEGGLHHAAAALGLPAAVLFGGFIAPEVTGYQGHFNFYRGGDGPGCGARQPCDHCRGAMAAIPPDEIIAAIQTMFNHF